MTTWKCVTCSTILDCKDCTNPNRHRCPCGSESWTPIEQDKAQYGEICWILQCTNDQVKGSAYCLAHREQLAELGLISDGPATNYASAQQIINDHIKVNIEQTAKGARVTVTYDRSDHNVEEAVNGAIQAYETTIAELQQRGMKVDDSKSS